MVEPSIDILDKYLKRQASDEEVRLVEDWIRQTGVSEETLRQLVVLPEGTKIMLSLDTQNDWLKVKQRLPNQKVILLRSPILRVAATILLLLAATFAIYFVGNSVFENRITYETIVNDDFHFKKVNLSDGSIAYLNRGSRITYGENFSNKRHLTMEGEVFFEVEHDKNNPFVINTKQTEITVLGTSFNVHADSGKVEVIVTSGRVSFQGQNADPIFLEKGESGVYLPAKQSIEKGHIRDPNYLSWKTGILEFENTPLDEVGHALEKHFNIKVIISDAISSAPAYTSSFDHPTLEEILNEMEVVLQIKWKLSENQKEVFIQVNN